MTEQQAHSPLGASGAERWMNCPGSVTLLKALDLPETDEPDYRREGTAAHEALAHCLQKDVATWEIVGQKFYDTEVTAGMADAISVFLQVARSHRTEGSKILIEQRIQFKQHKDGYGTVDYAEIAGNRLDVDDYKHGIGVAVDVEHNPQVMYYAYGILQDHPEIKDVYLRIVQPRAFHPEGPVRLWVTTADVIREWAETELIPAMNAVEIDNSLDAGKWCRFCPAKLVCPLMKSLFGAAMQANPKNIPNLSDEELGRSYQYTEAVKSYLKAMEEETFRRLNLGREVPDVKLVYKKANRVFKDGALEVFRDKFGGEAYTEPELKTPAQMEALGGEAKEMVKSWAYTPVTGLTVALARDKRPGVKVQPTADTFPNAVALAQ